MPGATGRRGPRPLALHLTTALALSLGSRAALPLWNGASPPWNRAPSAAAKDLRRALAAARPEAISAAIEIEARRELDQFLIGIERYRGAVYRRALPEPPVVWQSGTTRLLDFAAAGERAATGAPILVVPSLINRAYILDLDRNNSLIRYLAAAGNHPFLLDFGAPGPQEREFGLDGYITGRLEVALDRVVAATGRAPVVLGYCMGGLLALALATRRPRDVAALVLLATPWDFHAATGGPPTALVALETPLRALIDALGELPVDALQAMFTSLDIAQSWTKFRRFARMDPESDDARGFVAIEDWANDGVPLVAAVARECLFGWYLENQPARSAWRVAGRPVLPRQYRRPTLVVVPERDRIVPPPSADVLARALAGADRRGVATGHIGLVIGARARAEVWEPMTAWIARNATWP